jgi:thioredoxin-like negative regulator of GroEL
MISPSPERASDQPRLVFFYSPQQGRSRRVEGYIAQVLQRRQNHHTFRVHYVNEAKRPDIMQRFRVADVPALAVVVGKTVVGRLERPAGPTEIAEFLAPWLNGGPQRSRTPAG